MCREIINIQISVIMSIYSEPVAWVKESIDSILCQTFSDFEFIIINDNPNRIENESLLNNYRNLDNRIVVIENNENLGLTKCLNKGLDIAKGKYIARMDADDISDPNRLKLQHAYLENNLDYALIGTNAHIINEKGIVKGGLKRPYIGSEASAGLLFYNTFIHPSLFYRKTDIRYDESLKYSQDYDFVIRYSKIGKVVNVREKLIKYRLSKNQISTNKQVDQEVYANKVRMKHISRFLFDKLGVTESTLDSVLKSDLKSVLNRFEINFLLLSLIVFMEPVPFWKRLRLVIKFEFDFVLAVKMLIAPYLSKN